MNGADVIAHILKREGVEVLPCFPHSDLIEAAAALGIRPVVVRQERQAMHIADGYARVNDGRKLAAVTVQYGPGSENAMGSVAQCYADSSPVLFIPGGYTREDLAVDPNFHAARTLSAITKWCETVPSSERLPQMMQHAFAALRNGRPGPVVVEVPIDIFTEETSIDVDARYRLQRRSAPVADPTDIGALAAAFASASRPVIVAGQGIHYARAWEELIALAELTQTPVMTTLNGKSAFPENHPLALGAGGATRPDTVVHFLDRADLIVGLGTSFTRSDYITPFPASKRMVQLTNSDMDVSKDYPVDLAIIGDAKSSIAALSARLAEQGIAGDPGVAAEVKAVREAFLAEWMPLLTDEATPINPYRVVWELMHAVDREKTVVTHDAGNPRDQMVPFFESLVPHGYVGWGKTTQLGLGLGLMMGAKLARPDWLCVNVMGDAAFGMVGMEIETAVRCRIPTLTLILRNAVMGGYVKYHPTAAREYGIHELGGDYAAVARALGAHGERVEDPAQIKPAIERGIARTEEGQPAVIELITREEPRMAKKLPRG